MPRISVVVPTHNRQEFLAEALDSVGAQTLRDWECLVCDDGSTDGTAELVQTLSRRDPRFRLVPLPRSGKNGAVRNQGVLEAASPVVAFLDDDDLRLPASLALQLHVLETFPEAPFVFGRVERFGEGSGTWPRRIAGPWLALEELLRGNVVPLSTVAARRDALLAAGLFPVSTEATPDYELWLRMVRVAPAAALEDVLVRYRLHAGNISARRALEADELASLYDRLEAEWGLPSRLLAPGRRGVLRTRSRLARKPVEKLRLWLKTLSPDPR
jgi:glycosyltransferase involved in cell wall biosynthesis